MITRYWRLTAVSLLFSLALNLPFLREYLRYGSKSILSFNDIDEPNYLRLPFVLANGFGPESFYAEHRTPQPLLETLLGHPNRILDFFVGKAALAFELTPIQLGLFLDLLCCAIGFALGFLALRKLSKSNLTAFAATATMLAFPWIFWVSDYFTYDWGPGSQFASSLPSPYSVHFYPRIPIFRAIYTQVSVLLFLAVLVGSLRIATQQDASRLRTFILGALAGFGIYVYFFGWIACLLLPPVVFLAFNTGDKHPWPALLERTLLFYCAAFLVSSPGVFSLFYQNTGAPRLSELGNYWFLPLEYLMVIAGTGLLAYFSKPRSTQWSIAVLLTLLPLLDLFFSNLQPLFQMWLEPHHLGKYFLWPLYSALICVLLLDVGGTIVARRLSGAIALSFLPLLLLLTSSYEKELEREIPERSRFAELLSYMETNIPKDSVIGAYPFLEAPLHSGSPPLSNVSNIVSSLTGNPIFLQYTNSWLSRIPAKEIAQRERIVSWIYLGTASLIPPCGSSEESLPGDLFSFTSALRYISRKALCTRSEVDETAAPCEISATYQLHYLLTTQKMPIEELASRKVVQVWQSGDGVLALHRVDDLGCGLLAGNGELIRP